MKLISIKLGDGITIPDEFEFDDGSEIFLSHTSWTLKYVLITAHLFNNKDACFSYEDKNNVQTEDYSNFMDYVYFILTCGISFIRYYKNINEWIDPYKPCYEHHENLDIKHKLWNLRKVKTINWGHYDIIRNIDQYCNYVVDSRFARESLINFYSRFLKLSRLKNNKKLCWILDVTDSFLHYGFAIPSNEYSFKCVCEDNVASDKTCIMLNTTTLKIWYHDEPEKEYTSCRYQKPNLKNPDLICEYIQRYYAKTSFTRKFGIRQDTNEIIKMQLTDEEFTFYGTPPYRLYEVFKNRIHIKTSSVKCFENVMFYLIQCINVVKPHPVVSTVAVTPAQLNNQNIHNFPAPIWAEIKNPLPYDTFYLTSQDPNILIAIDCLIDFLKINKQHFNKFIKYCELNLAQIGILLNIAKHNPIFQSGELSSIGVKLERYRLLNS